MALLFRLYGSARPSPEVQAWFAADPDGLRALTRRWFDHMCACGPDVRQIMHDGHATAYVGDVAFAHVKAFAAHANVGFFHGVDLPDPAGLLEGTGKRMRHVKLHPARPVDEAALRALIDAAYRDIGQRLAADIQDSA